MRGVFVGTAITSLLFAGLVGAPPATAQDVSAAVAPVDNPFIAETCGLDATLILDASGSIQSAGAVNTVRNAGKDLMNALKDTNSTLRITQFATFSGQLSSRVPVNAATTGGGGALSTALNNYYTPPPSKPIGVTIYNGNQVQNSALTWTNWEDGIKGIDDPELAIYITDGDPTAYNASATRTNVNTSSTGTALDNAITQANALKLNGTRMLVVGVGNGLTSSSSQDRLKKISGPLLEKSAAALAGKTINQVDAVAFTDFTALGVFLRSVVTSLCGNSVTVQKLAQSSSGADYLPAPGWDITVEPSVSGGYTWVDPTGSEGPKTRATSGAQGTAAFQWKPKVASQTATVKVSESVKTEFTADRWTCDIKDTEGGTTTVSGTLGNDPSFQFQMEPSDVAACKLYNDFNYSPGISITKVAADDPIRGNGIGWDETYTFTVTNTGNATLSVTKPIDPQCTAVSAPSGPGAASGKLAPGDAWTYTCQVKIGPLPTRTTPITHPNTVSVAGIDPSGFVVTDSANESIDVKTPRINIAKTAKKTVGGGAIPDGGTVSAGTKVTYVYTVTNTGNDTLNLVRASAVTDDKCSPVNYKSGDTDNNQKLETGETWIYECDTVLNPPSSVTSVTNKAEVTSTWSNPQSRPQNNGAVTDTDQMTIDIDRGANLRVVKVTEPGEVDQDFSFTVAGPGVAPDDQAFDLNTSTDPSTPPASRTLLLDGPQGGGSEYTITEADADGWDLKELRCDTTATKDLPNGEIKVIIEPTEDVTCTFTNKRRPSLTITKQTSPADSDAEFGFTASSPLSPSTFDLKDGQSREFTNLAPGTVTINEATIPAGWELDGISCNVDFTRTDAQIEVTLAYGDEAECVYTNAALPPATLTIVKDEVPSTWSDKFDFNVQGTGLVDPGQPGSSDFSLDLGDSKTYTVRPGSGGNDYTVTEKSQPAPPTGQSGFELTDIECVVNGDADNPVSGDTTSGKVLVTLKPTDSAVCTYTNQQKPRLTIVKNAVDPENAADDTEFSFNATGLSPANFTLKNSLNTQAFTDIVPGAAFTVTEATPPSDWTLTSLECTGDGSEALSVASGQVSGDLDYADDVVCTYVNTKAPPKAFLYVLKNTDPADSLASFSFNATDGGVFNENFPLTGGDYQSFEVDPGTYTVTEAPKPGWDLVEADCVVGPTPNPPVGGDLGNRSATVTLANGDIGVCVFENQQRASLKVDKVTDVSSSQQFEFTASSVPPGISPTAFSLLGGGTPQDFTNIGAGSQIEIQEDVPTSAPDRWSLSGIECDGVTSPVYNLNTGKADFTLPAGAEATCTYSDTKVPTATVQIVKVADPADGTQFDFTASGADGGVVPADQAFSLAPDGDIDVKTMTVYPADGGEMFTFTEPTVPANWNLDSIQCVDAGSPVGTADLQAGKIEVGIDPGDSLTCTFTNRKDASLTVIKEAGDDPEQEFDFERSFGADFSLKDQQSEPTNGLTPGAYTVQEVNLPVDWYLSSPDGAHPVCVGTAAAVDYSPELGATVTLAAGEDATCTFSNFFDYRPQMELVKTPDRTVTLEGKPVVYTYELTNTGNVELAPVGDLNDIVVDDQCTSVSITSGGVPPVLQPGETWTFKCTVASMTPTKATNIATATMQGPDGELTATDTQTVEVRVPKLGLEKTASKPTVYPGTNVTYTYVASNLGETPFEGPAGLDDWLTDNKCSPVTYVSGDTGDDQVMGVGEVWTYTCTTAISVNTTNTGTFTATPFIDEGGPKQTGDPMQATDTAQVEVIQKGIDITKSASAPGGVVQSGVLLVPVGTEVTYTYEITSGAATTAMKVLDVTDDRCAPVEYQSGDTNSNGLVDPGETWMYTCKATFSGAATVINTAVVTAVEPILGGISTDSDNATVRSYKGSIAIKKSPSAELVAKGTPVTYTYTVLNNGTVDLTDITVKDDKCSPVTYKSGDNGDGVLKPDEEWTFECVSALQDDTTNIADATGTTPSGGKVTDATSVTVLVIGGRLNPAIAVVKTPSATRVDKGDKVTYTYDVTNVGTMPLANIRVSDDKCSPVTYVKGDDNGDGLLTSSSMGEGWPDETWTYTCTTAINKDTTNTVTALGAPWDAGQIVGKDVSAQAQATVKVRQVLPIDVVVDKNCKGDKCTLVKKSKTNKKGTLKYKVRCRPVSSSAAGEVRYCRTKVGKNGAVSVTIKGYPQVKVTLWITAVPKPKYKDSWVRNTWKRTWVIRR